MTNQDIQNLKRLIERVKVNIDEQIKTDEFIFGSSPLVIIQSDISQMKDILDKDE